MRGFRALIIIILGSLAAYAGDWQVLDGVQIAQVLTDEGVTYEGARQRFYASGRTLYNAGHDNWGYWRVEGDQYCSSWPPSDLWVCYEVTQSGDMIRFTGADGSVTDGVLQD